MLLLVKLLRCHPPGHLTHGRRCYHPSPFFARLPGSHNDFNLKPRSAEVLVVMHVKPKLSQHFHANAPRCERTLGDPRSNAVASRPPVEHRAPKVTLRPLARYFLAEELRFCVRRVQRRPRRIYRIQDNLLLPARVLEHAHDKRSNRRWDRLPERLQLFSLQLGRIRLDAAERLAVVP